FISCAHAANPLKGCTSGGRHGRAGHSALVGFTIKMGERTLMHKDSGHHALDEMNSQWRLMTLRAGRCRPAFGCHRDRDLVDSVDSSKGAPPSWLTPILTHNPQFWINSSGGGSS